MVWARDNVMRGAYGLGTLLLTQPTSPQRSQVPTTVSPAGVSMRKWCLHSIAILIIAYWAAYVRWFGQDYVG